MVTSLPPVHVALMGIERLVPTLDDLALFLSLLPRSATGQKVERLHQLDPFPETLRGCGWSAGTSPDPGGQRAFRHA